MRAEKVTAYLLENSAAVTAIVGTKITAVLGLQADEAPMLMYWKDQAARDLIIGGGGPHIVRALMSVQCVAKDYATLKNLAEAVRLALTPQYGTIAGVAVNSIQVEAEGSDFYDPELNIFGQLWQFTVTHEE